MRNLLLWDFLRLFALRCRGKFEAWSVSLHDSSQVCGCVFLAPIDWHGGALFWENLVPEIYTKSWTGPAFYMQKRCPLAKLGLVQCCVVTHLAVIGLLLIRCVSFANLLNRSQFVVHEASRRSARISLKKRNELLNENTQRNEHWKEKKNETWWKKVEPSYFMVYFFFVCPLESMLNTF